MDIDKARERMKSMFKFCDERKLNCAKCELNADGVDCNIEYGFKLGVGTAVNYAMGKISEIDLSKIENPNDAVMTILASARDLYEK